jgi:hypothetical protein
MGQIVSIEQVWKEEQTQCQTCVVCKDIIYSSVYRLTVDVNDKEIKTEVVLCNSCKDAI